LFKKTQKLTILAALITEMKLQNPKEDFTPMENKNDLSSMVRNNIKNKLTREDNSGST
jgi:hypothetical protein